MRLRDQSGIQPCNRRRLLPEINFGYLLEFRRPLAETHASAAARMLGTLGLDRVPPGVGFAAPVLAARAPRLLFRRRTPGPHFGHALKWADQNPGDHHDYEGHSKHNYNAPVSSAVDVLYIAHAQSQSMS